MRQVQTLQEQLKQDPSISLTEKEKNMIQRGEKYQQYKNKFYQDNLDIDREEFKTARITLVRNKRRIFEIKN